MTREDLIAKIEAADLTNPEIVADYVLSAFDERGEDAALAELARAVANETR